MSIDTIEQEFKEKVSAKVRLVAEGVNRYRVSTPFRFDDGESSGYCPKAGRDSMDAVR